MVDDENVALSGLKGLWDWELFLKVPELDGSFIGP